MNNGTGSYPETLDEASCGQATANNPLFETISFTSNLPITTLNWFKFDDTNYYRYCNG